MDIIGLINNLLEDKMERTKARKIILIMIIVLLLVVIIAGGAYAFLATDMFKTPDQLFKKYLISDVIQVSKFNSEPYGEASKRMQNEPVEITSKSTISHNLSESNLNEENDNEAKVTSTVTYKSDIPNKNQALSIDLKNNDEDFFGLDFLITDNTYGIHVDELHDKYIAVENRDFKKIAETFGVDEEIIDTIPDSIPEFSFTSEEKAKLSEIAQNYLNKIFNQIDTNSYTKEKYTIDNFDGESFSGNKYTLTISEIKLGNIIKNAYKDLLQDQEFMSLLEPKIPNQLIERVKESASEIELLEESSDDKNIKISLYEANGKTVKTEVIFEKYNVTSEFYILNKDTSSHMYLKYNMPQNDTNEVASEVTVDVTNTFENNNGEYIIKINQEYNKDDIEKLKNDYDDNYYEEEYKDINITYKMETSVENDVINSNISYESNDENFSNQKSTYTMKFGNDIKVPVLDNNNKIIVNDYSIEEFEKLGEEIVQNVLLSANENPNTLIGSILGMFNTSDGISGTSSMDDLDDIDNINSNSPSTEVNAYNNDEFDNAFYKDHVSTTIEDSIKKLLEEYHYDLEVNPDANPADYLTVDKIEENAGIFIDEIELIDGNTLKCVCDEYTYFVKINIDGNEWKLVNTETLYSEDGTLESAM